LTGAILVLRAGGAGRSALFWLATANLVLVQAGDLILLVQILGGIPM
jgi:hypothetical protein